MSNDPIGRAITTALDPYWQNHPNQRDAIHGLYHNIAGNFWNAVGQKEKAEKDFKRRDDHWVRHENRENYRKRTGRSRSKSK